MKGSAITPEQYELFIKCIEEGVEIKKALAVAGFGKEALRRKRRDDLEYHERVKAALKVYAADEVEEVEQVMLKKAKKGSFKAARLVMPAYMEQYQPRLKVEQDRSNNDKLIADAEASGKVHPAMMGDDSPASLPLSSPSDFPGADASDTAIIQGGYVPGDDYGEDDGLDVKDGRDD